MSFDAYYYSFEPTGNANVDAILEAVADAGKVAHHTGDWREYAKIIQDMANRSASNIADLAQKEAAAPGDLHAAISKKLQAWRDGAGIQELGIGYGAANVEFANDVVVMMTAYKALARAALAQPVAVDAPQGWISMADRMPPNGESVLIFFPKDVAEPYRIDMWDEWHEDPIGMGGPTVCVGEGFMSYGDDDITHWMPLPAPPVAAIDAHDGEAM